MTQEPWQHAADYPQATERLIVMNCLHPAAFQKNIRSNLHQLWRSWYMLFFSQQLPFLFGFSPCQESLLVLKVTQGWQSSWVMRLPTRWRGMRASE